MKENTKETNDYTILQRKIDKIKELITTCPDEEIGIYDSLGKTNFRIPLKNITSIEYSELAHVGFLSFIAIDFIYFPITGKVYSSGDTVKNFEIDKMVFFIFDNTLLTGEED